ncbi:MAG: hypothetical protein HY550_02165 [Elusimicrobia bacterium]|nr:hypothetical protein [Elusimicrobiota bacterium]
MKILPPPQKDGEIKFWFAKSLPYRTRMTLVGLLLALGLGLQVMLNFWPGFCALLAGLLLGINSGYDAKPKKTREETWERVTPDEYAKVKLKAGQLREWDEDFFDGTSLMGLAGFLAAGLICLLAYAAAAGTFSFPDGTWVYFGLDAAVLILPMWFIGTRDYLKKDRLIIKIDMLEKVMAALRDPSDLQVQPMLSLAGTQTGGKVPEDARLMVKLVGAPKDFYGLQVQLSVNNVQGKDFPYLYCVLLAKAGSGLLEGWEKFAAQPESKGLLGLVGELLGKAPTGIVYEPSRSGEVDIIVVRQRTTKTSGYHTAVPAALGVVGNALKLARGLLAGRAAAAGAAG